MTDLERIEHNIKTLSECIESISHITCINKSSKILNHINGVLIILKYHKTILTTPPITNEDFLLIWERTIGIENQLKLLQAYEYIDTESIYKPMTFDTIIRIYEYKEKIFIRLKNKG